MSIEVDPLIAALTLGSDLINELHGCSSSFEARRRVYGMTEHELRAFALSQTFSNAQQRLSSDDYAEWCT